MMMKIKILDLIHDLNKTLNKIFDDSRYLDSLKYNEN